MRSNDAVRQNVLGRAGRLVSAETTPDQQLSQLTVRWAPGEDGSFQRLTVERVDGKLQSRSRPASSRPARVWPVA